MPGQLQTALGRNLRAFRDAEGMTREAFAERLRLDRDHLRALERGDADVCLRTVETIAGKVGIEALLLLEAAGAPASATAEQPQPGSI
jgi:transcriptional regulator with XRE-family HTH domain